MRDMSSYKNSHQAGEIVTPIAPPEDESCLICGGWLTTDEYMCHNCIGDESEE